MENNEIIEPGKFVKYSYTLTDADTGETLFETPAGKPDEMIYGVSQDVVPGLIAALKDLKVGDRFEVTLPPEAAFGPAFPENVIELDKDVFMRDGEMAEEVVPGAELPMMTADGFRVLGRILEIGDKVKMDFNHPFAGKVVTYKGQVDEVRDATPAELAPQQGCSGCSGCGSREEGCNSDNKGCSSCCH